MRSQPPVLVTYYVETDDGKVNYETNLRSDAVATAAILYRQKRNPHIIVVESTAVSVHQVAA
jgi:hypothetical protein